MSTARSKVNCFSYKKKRFLQIVGNDHVLYIPFCVLGYRLQDTLRGMVLRFLEDTQSKGSIGKRKFLDSILENCMSALLI